MTGAEGSVEPGPDDGRVDDDRVDDSRPGVEDAAARGMEALQGAARELIAAARAMLDVADDLVSDPRTVGGVLSALSAMAAPLRQAGTGGGSDAGRRGPDDGEDEDDGDGRVQRIPVS